MCPCPPHREWGHGRIEIHRGWVLDDLEGHWLNLCNLLLVEAKRRVGGRVNETRYFISSHVPTRGIC